MDPEFLSCVMMNIVANIPLIIACDSGNRATYALKMVQNSNILMSSVVALRPGGIKQITGYPVDRESTIMDAKPILFNSYISTSTAIGMMAHTRSVGRAFRVMSEHDEKFSRHVRT
jgi:hypothetical protein